MVLTATTGGYTTPILLDTLDITKRLDQRTTCTFTALDSTSALYLQQNQRIVIADTLLGTLFTGIVDKVDDTHTLGINTTMTKVVAGKDLRYFADKRTVTDAERTLMMAGDILCDLHATYMAAEGILATYCMRRDTTGANLGAGTLIGTTAIGNSLQLSSAGSSYSKKETTTGDFSSGTLTNVVAENNSLVLRHFNALKLAGTAYALQNVNLFYYVIFANNINYTVQTGDIFAYDLYIPSSCPTPAGGIDIQFTDGGHLKDMGFPDQLGYNCHPGESRVGAVATDQWYHREIAMTNPNTTAVGKVVAHAAMGLEGDTAGSYAFYIANAVIKSSTGTTRATLYSSGTPQANIRRERYGYMSTTFSNVVCSWHIGTRITSANSIASVGILRDSVISWTSTGMYTPPSTQDAKIPVFVESSYDSGASWQLCSPGQPLPNTIAGMNCSGKSLLLKTTVQLTIPSPEGIQIGMADCTVTIRPSYTCSKTDYADSDYDSTSFSAGTLSNTEYANGGLRILGDYRGWDVATDLNNQTTYSTNGANPVAMLESGRLSLRCGVVGASSWMATRFDWAGTWQNFTCEFDFQSESSTGNIFSSILYRTTGWQNTNDFFYAYTMQFENGKVTFRRGNNSNSGANTDTLIATSIPYTLTNDTMYHVKLVVQGTLHQCYINDTLYINNTDTTYTGAGYFGAKLSNGNTARDTAYFENFGVSSTPTGNRVHPSMALSGVAENSIIQWNELQTTATSILVESSIDGSTWQPCTNGQPIPGIVNGTSITGKTLRVRETLSTTTISVTPYLLGISWLIVGNYSSTGTRVSPVLPITSVGIIGDTSMTWDASMYANTTLKADSSLNGSTWTQVFTPGDPIPGLGVTTDPLIDDYLTGTGANYTSSYVTGGAIASYLFDTANSRLQMTAGNKSIYTCNSATGANTSMDLIQGRAEKAGPLLRYSSAATFYYVEVNDSASAANPNTLQLFKINAGVVTQLGSTQAISFTRDTYHTIRFTAIGSTLTVLFDGVQVLTITDASIASGKAGLYGKMQYVQSSRAQVLGDDSTGKTVYTRLTLTTTDPLVTPIVWSVTASVKNRNIENGVLIGATNFQYASSVGAAGDTLAQAGNTYWYIDEFMQLYNQSRYGTPAPWPVCSPMAGENANILGTPVLTHSSPLYRNKQYITGAMDTVHYPENWLGDGVRQSIVLSYPVDSIVGITINGRIATYGVTGDAGSEYYYTVGSPILQHDPALAPIDTSDTVAIDYYGQIAYVAMAEDTIQQGILAALENSTGIVEAYENVSGISKATADRLAQARITQYAILARQLKFSVLQNGLRPGMLTYFFIPEYRLQDTPLLLSEVQVHIRQFLLDGVPTVRAVYDVVAVEGPDIGSWSKLFIQPT